MKEKIFISGNGGSVGGSVCRGSDDGGREKCV